MVKRIRVTVTSVYEYDPDFEDDTAYLENQITSIEEALELDRKEYDQGKIGLDELCFNLPSTSAQWEIVDVPNS